MTHLSKDSNVNWYYNESSHGKGLKDGLGGNC